MTTNQMRLLSVPALAVALVTLPAAYVMDKLPERFLTSSFGSKIYNIVGGTCFISTLIVIDAWEI